MASIALIGPDGSGKTTLCKRLEASSLFPLKYVYMGINFSASNVALPTTRLVTWWRARRSQRFHDTPPLSPLSSAKGARKRLRFPRDIVRLLNRLAEEWYRQFVSWFYQWRGYIVLYDRHFAFDFAAFGPADPDEPWSKRVHRWFLARFYPRPNFVILLDAPAEILFGRKGEFSPGVLDERRRVLMRQAQIFGNFIRVDAAQPIDRVYSMVLEQVLKFHGKYRVRRRSSERPARHPVEE